MIPGPVLRIFRVCQVGIKVDNRDRDRSSTGTTSDTHRTSSRKI